MVMAAYCLVYGVIHFTSPCGLTACTPGSAPGPTLSNEYGKTLPFYYYYYYFFKNSTDINQCFGTAYIHNRPRSKKTIVSAKDV